MENWKALAESMRERAKMLLAMAIIAEEKEVNDELNLEKSLANLKLKGKEEVEKVEVEEVEKVEVEEKWLKYYSSKHKILLVGEGDFSFSLCLARAFGSASNIVATSLDSYDELVEKYNDAKANLESLQELGASLFHGVDVLTMRKYPRLKMLKLDRIIFNFPHAGFIKAEDHPLQMVSHKILVYGFFLSARDMLLPDGEIHINHKTTHPYNKWDLEGIALKNSLALIERVDFKKEDYPGYNQKRGASSRTDKPFNSRNVRYLSNINLGVSSTFDFECIKIFDVKAIIMSLDPLSMRGPRSRSDESFKLGECSTFKFKLSV